MLGFGPCWFIRIDPNAPFPRFEAVGVIRDDAALYFGPLPRRKDADSLIRLLEDAFDLCRDYDILLKTPNGERCAYYDMGRCPAPCDGTVPMDVYSQSIREAIAFLESSADATLAPIRRRMQDAVDRLAFESAAAYKRTIDDAEFLRRKSTFAFVVNVTPTNWLAIVRASVKRKKTEETRLKAYCIAKGRIHELATGRTGELASLSASWRNAARIWSESLTGIDARIATESLRLLTRFLFKDNQRDALIFPLSDLRNTETLLEALGPLLDTKRRY